MPSVDPLPALLPRHNPDLLLLVRRQMRQTLDAQFKPLLLPFRPIFALQSHRHCLCKLLAEQLDCDTRLR